jgi:hypothetical protein
MGNPPKKANKCTAEAKKSSNLLAVVHIQLDLCGHTMSIVHIFATSTRSKQAWDEHGFTYYLNRSHEKVTYWRCSKKGC